MNRVCWVLQEKESEAILSNMSVKSPLLMRLTIALTVLLFLQSATSAHAHVLSKIRQTPDLTQTMIQGLPNHGEQYCAPTAVANALLWLAGQEDSSIQLGDSQELVARLGSRKFMKTSSEYGTTPDNVLSGLDRYLKGLKVEGYKISYQGWRKHHPRYSMNTLRPNMQWVLKKAFEMTGVWLNVGWYKASQEQGRYERIGGHWVTLVGVEVYEGSFYLIIHDPSPRAGENPQSHRVSFKEMKSGQLVGKQQGLPLSAEGFYRLGHELVLHPEADIAVLDGVAVLEVNPKETQFFYEPVKGKPPEQPAALPVTPESSLTMTPV